jgi:hypothetical protein
VLDVLAVVGLATREAPRRRGVLRRGARRHDGGARRPPRRLAIRAPYWDPILILYAVPAVATLVRRD